MLINKQINDPYLFINFIKISSRLPLAFVSPLKKVKRHFAEMSQKFLIVVKHILNSNLAGKTLNLPIGW